MTKQCIRKKIKFHLFTGILALYLVIGKMKELSEKIKLLHWIQTGEEAIGVLIT